MLFSESHGPDINLEALYLDFFFSFTPMRTAVSWTLTQEGRRTGLKALSPFVGNNHATDLPQGKRAIDDVRTFREVHPG